MAENSQLAAMDTSKAASDTAQQWSQYNSGLAQQGYYNALTTGANLKNQTTQEAMDRDALARRIINNNFTAPGQTRTAPGDTQTPTTPTTPTTPNSSQTSYNTSLGSLVPNAYTGPSYAPPTQSLNIPQMPQAPQANQGTPASSTLPLGSLANLGNTPPQIPLQQQKPQASQIPVMDPNSPERTAMRVFPNSAPTSGVTSDPTSHAPIQITPIGSFNRQGAYDEMVANGLGPEAEDLRKQWTNDDLVSEKIKLEKNIAAHAQLVAGIAAFKSLPDSMKPAAYAQEKQGLASLGVNISQMPDKYDPNNPDNVAYVDNLAAQATSAQDKLKDKHADVEDNIKQQTANNQNKYQTGVIAAENAKNAETTRHNKAEEAIEEEKNKAVNPNNADTGSLNVPLRPEQQQLTGTALLNTMTPAQQARAIGIANGQVPFGQRQQADTKNGGAAEFAMVQRLFPGVNIAATQKWAQEEANQRPGSVGGNVIALNNAVHHAGQLVDLSQTGGQSNVNMLGIGPGLNRASNLVSGAPDEGAFNNTKQALLTEVQTFLSRGHPAERGIENLLSNLKYTDTPDKKNKTIKSVLDLLQGQSTSLEQQRANVFKQLNPGTSYLDDGSKNVINDVYTNNHLPSPIHNPTVINPTAATQSNPQAAPGLVGPRVTGMDDPVFVKLPPGSPFVTPSGRQKYK